MTASIYSTISTLQEEAVAALRETAALSAVDVVQEDRKDIVTAIQIAVKKLGLCLVVSTAAATTTRPNLPGPSLDRIQFQVDACEHVLINRAASGSGISALKAACLVAAALHHLRPSAGGGCVYLTDPGVQHIPDDSFLIYRVHFRIGT